jgi:SAM-dependent methyltransferase
MPYLEPHMLEPGPLRDYACEGWRDILGWGIAPFATKVFLTLDRYQKQRGIRGNLLEIGVFRGRTACLLGLMAAPGERLFGIDVFNDARNIDHSGAGAERAEFDSNIARWKLTERTDVIEGDSMFLDFAQHGIGKVRFAHIDGAHYVDAVCNDIIKAQQIMVPGGVVVVDDWHNNRFPGTNEACHRFLSYAVPRLVIPFAVGMNKLYLTTHSHHYDLLHHFLGETACPVARLHGLDVATLTDGMQDPDTIGPP